MGTIIEVPDDILDVQPDPLVPTGPQRLQILNFADTVAKTGRRMWKITTKAVDHPDSGVFTTNVLFPALTDKAEDQKRRKQEVEMARRLLGIEPGMDTDELMDRIVELPVTTEGSPEDQYGVQNRIAFPRMHN